MTGSSRKVGGATKGLGEAPKSCTRKEHESATNSIAKRGQGAIAPCRVKGQRPLWGLGQRPNCSLSDQSQGSRQQRRRQRSVPASIFARPQTRPQAALPPRFREKPNDSHPPGAHDSKKMVNFCATPGNIAQFSSIVHCAHIQERPPAFPLTSAPYFYPIFKFAAQDFTPAGNLTAPPSVSAAAPACGHPPRPPAWASPTVPPHTADSAS